MSENRSDFGPPPRRIPPRPDIPPERSSRLYGLPPRPPMRTSPEPFSHSRPPSRNIPPSRTIIQTPSIISSEEHKPIVSVQPTENVKSQNEIKISRRKFLSLAKTTAALVAADSLLSHLPSKEVSRLGFTRPLWELLESGTLTENPAEMIKQIEETFKVQLLSPSKGVAKVKGSDEVGEVDTVEWDTPRLQALALTLKDLPPHFYAPWEKNGKKISLKIALYERSFIRNLIEGGASECNHCQGDTETPMLILQKDALGKTIFDKDARQTIVHELTHYVTSARLSEYDNSILKPVGLSGDNMLQAFASEIDVKRRIYDYNTSWKNKAEYEKSLATLPPDEKPIFINDVIGVSPSLISLQGKDYFVKRWESASGKDTVESWRKQGKVYIYESPKYAIDDIKVKSHIGYGAQNDGEFFSVAAEYYFLGGKKKFIDAYRPFLDEERTNLLYEGIKREIFLGKEY